MNPAVRMLFLGGRRFDPSQLFAAGEQGAWYDPSDFSSLYQDSAGTTPVTALEQPCGLLLDKRYSLVRGANILANGTFDADTSGWTGNNASLSVDTGRMKITNTAAANGTAGATLTTVAGTTYEVLCTVTAGTSGGARLLAGTTQYNGQLGVSAFSTGDRRLVFVATGATTYLSVQLVSATNGQYDYVGNITVRSIPGNHASQSTAGSRPTLNAGGKINFSSGTKSLVTTWGSSLGSSCTVARALPGGTASILTGQTIGTTYTDTTDHCGLVIINRNLTPSETAQLTRYLARKGAAG